MNRARTLVLFVAMSAVLLGIGSMLDAGSGSNLWLTTMLVISLVMNGASYFFSDRLAIRMARAEPMDEARFPDVYEMVRRLAEQAAQPRPCLYLLP
jgi:heat shock protein HtpX